MGNSSNKNTNSNNSPNSADQDHTMLTYRVQLPSQPIISPEKDQQYLLYNNIEEVEMSKALFILPSAQHNLMSLFNMKKNELMFQSLIPVISTFTYRYIRFSKNKSKLYSTSFATILGFLYFNMIKYLFNFSVQFYVNFLGAQLLQIENGKEEDYDRITTEYFDFTTKYKNNLEKL